MGGGGNSGRFISRNINCDLRGDVNREACGLSSDGANKTSQEDLISLVLSLFTTP